jgi:hypothetical protein
MNIGYDDLVFASAQGLFGSKGRCFGQNIISCFFLTNFKVFFFLSCYTIGAKLPKFVTLVCCWLKPTKFHQSRTSRFLIAISKF